MHKSGTVPPIRVQIVAEMSRVGVSCNPQRWPVAVNYYVHMLYIYSVGGCVVLVMQQTDRQLAENALMVQRGREGHALTTLPTIQRLLTDGFFRIDNVEAPTLQEHREATYLKSAHTKLRTAGLMVHKRTPDLNDMIQFVQELVPEKYHGLINHAWSGIGDWQA